MYRVVSGAAALALATAACGARGCGEPARRTADAQTSSTAPTPPAPTSSDKPVTQPCTLELAADRDATRDDVLGLLLPDFHPGSPLPARHPPPSAERPDVAGVFLVKPCRGQAMESLSPPAIGQLQRLSLGDGRELVQFPVGTKEGLAEYTLGVLAILSRQGRTLRALNVAEAAADLPGGLVPFQRARIGDTVVLLQSEATSAASEDYERGHYVSVDYFIDNQLHLAGVMWERRASDATFWQGPYDWQMTSPGIEKTAAGYLVHEHWTFTHKKTHRQSSRDVLRQYTLVGHQLMTSPLDDLDAWPETRSPLTPAR